MTGIEELRKGMELLLEEVASLGSNGEDEGLMALKMEGVGKGSRVENGRSWKRKPS